MLSMWLPWNRTSGSLQQGLPWSLPSAFFLADFNLYPVILINRNPEYNSLSEFFGAFSQIIEPECDFKYTSPTSVTQPGGGEEGGSLPWALHLSSMNSICSLSAICLLLNDQSLVILISCQLNSSYSNYFVASLLSGPRYSGHVT